MATVRTMVDGLTEEPLAAHPRAVLAIFTTASFLVGAAPAGWWLIAARALQGIGASLGLVVGGALADWVSWRAGFLVNIPIGFAMIAADHVTAAVTGSALLLTLALVVAAVVVVPGERARCRPGRVNP